MPARPVTSRDITRNGYADFVALPVVRQVDGAGRHGLTVERHAGNTAADPRGVVDHHMIDGGTMTVRDLVAGPLRRDARINLQVASMQLKANQLAEPVYQVQPPRPVCGGAP